MMPRMPTGPSDLLRRAAASRPDHLALVDGAHRLTFAELDRQVSAAAAALLARGLSGR